MTAFLIIWLAACPGLIMTWGFFKGPQSMIDLAILSAGTIGICLGTAATIAFRRARPVPLSVTRAFRKERSLRLKADMDLKEAQAEVVDLRWGLDEVERKFKAECQYVERLLAERDLAAGQAKFWAGEAANSARLMIDMGVARDAAASPARVGAVVLHPVFGRRKAPPPSIA